MTACQTEIMGSPDCGNSPKNAFVQSIAIALETGVADPDSFDTAVTWQRTASGQITGQAPLLEAISAKRTPIKVVVEHAIAHGRVGAASGETVMADGERRRFSHVLVFTNTRADCVAIIKSYS